MADFPHLRNIFPVRANTGRTQQITYRPQLSGGGQMILPPNFNITPASQAFLPPASPVFITPGLTPSPYIIPDGGVPSAAASLALPPLSGLAGEIIIPPGAVLPEPPCGPSPADTPAGISPLEALRNVLPSVRLNTVTIENSSFEEADASGTQECNLIYNLEFAEKVNQQITGSAVIPWYDNINYTNYLRLRVVTCWGSRGESGGSTAAALDFASQRLNQQQRNKPLQGTLAPTGFTPLSDAAYFGELGGVMDREFGASRGSIILGDVFDCYNLTNNYFKSGRGFEPPGTTRIKAFPRDPVLKNVIVTDASIRDLISRNEDGDAIRRRTRSVQHGTSLQIETVPLKPLLTKFWTPKLRPSDSEAIASDLSHLSQYTFVYLDYKLFLEEMNLDSGPAPSANPLELGMSFIDVSTEIGNYTQYEAQPYDADFVLGTAVSNSISEPQIAKLHDLRLFSTINHHRIDTSLYETVFDTMNGSLVDAGSFKIIKDKNFFSDLWISKDENEDARYIFSFDKLSFLMARSKFPRLYMNPEISDILINGGELLDVQDAATILDIRMKRRRLNYTSFRPNNNLGTYVRLDPYKLTDENPEEIIESPARLNDIAVGNDNADTASRGFSFFEGTDKYTKEENTRSLVRFQYGCDVYVTDPSTKYLKNLSNSLAAYQKVVDDIEQYITSSPPPYPGESVRLNLVNVNEDGYGLYDYSSQMMTIKLEQIVYGNAIAADLVYAAITAYVSTLKNLDVKLGLNPVTSALWTYDDVERNLRSMVSTSLDPRMISLVSSLIKHLVFRLNEIIGKQINLVDAENGYVPHSIMAQRGFCQRKFVLHEKEHYFDTPFEFGRRYKVGYSYLKDNDWGDRSTTRKGLMRVKRSHYDLRVLGEFDKYFASDSFLSTVSEIPINFRESAVKFFSPLEIKTFDKEPVVQPLYRNLDAPVCLYDVDRYGELFSDLIKIKKETAYLNRPFYAIEDPGSKQDTENELLFKSLVSSLGSHYCSIKRGIQSLFSVPSPSYTFQYMPPNFLGIVSTLRFDPATNRVFSETTISNLLPYIIGGVAKTSTELIYENEVSDRLKEIQDKDEPGKIDITYYEPPELAGQPIKVTFGILGELEIDSQMSKVAYEKRLFNSLVLEAANHGLLEVQNWDGNVNKIENDMIEFPNQLRSMYAVACLVTPGKFNNGDLTAVRCQLEDEDSGGNPISSLIPEQQFPPFSLVRDPMKVYAKFLTFWMNYKQLVTVECLSGFGSLSTNFLYDRSREPSPEDSIRNFYARKQGLPLWKQIDEALLGKNLNKKLLCRIRPLENAHSKSLFDLPIYNRYFVLEIDPPGKRYGKVTIDPTAFMPAFIPGETPEPVEPRSADTPTAPNLGGAIVPDLRVTTPPPPAPAPAASLGGLIGGSAPASFSPRYVFNQEAVAPLLGTSATFNPRRGGYN